MDSISNADIVHVTRPYSKPPSMANYQINEVPAQRPRPRVKKQPPQTSIDEFWDKFTTKHPGKIFTILPDNLYAKRAAAHARKGSVPGQNALASYEEAANACRKKVEKIVKECRRLNQKYRDPHFDIESDFKRAQQNPEIPPDCLAALNEEKTEFHPMSVKRIEDIFDRPRFFIEGATANDVRQGNDGDCWFMSALCTISNKEGLIQRVCVARDEQVGVYGFVFHRDGEWISEVIDDKLYLIKEDFDDATLGRHQWLELQNRKSPEEEYRTAMQTGSRALYFAQCSDPNETWLPLLEKAYAKAHGDYSAIDGGFVGEGIEDLTGGVTSEVFATDILDKDKFWREELLNVNKTFLFGCGQMGGIYGERKGIQEKHAYSIMEAREIDGQRLLKLRNPWGRSEWNGRWSDGSEEWTPEWMQKLNHRFGDDGVFWISYRDLLRHYQHFDRTRLFGPEWTVSQQWTSVNVPWSVDYLDTKFKIHLSRPSPVVIVLQQLDDRYFQGLEGEYEFSLQFRLHKDDEEDYIVRSNGAYFMKRSVSTELDLEAGNYTVLLKVKATRVANPRPQDVIRNTCTTRREKLLSIGLSYDLAHAKGQFRERLKQKALRERENKIERKKAELRRAKEQRAKARRKDKLREQKKAAKTGRKKHRHSVSRDRDMAHDLAGLGIHTDDEHRPSGDEEEKRASQRANTLPIAQERSASPSGGFGGRGGYNAPLPSPQQPARKGGSMKEVFQGRGGYNTAVPGPSSTGFQSPSFAGRDGYNMGRDGYNMGRDGYNMGRDGYNMGRDGYNMGRDGYNESDQQKESPNPGTGTGTIPTDGSRPGTPTQKPFSPAHNRRSTLSPIPGVRPGIQITRNRGISVSSNRARDGIYTPSEMSDYSSWDSELDGPDTDDCDFDTSEDENDMRRYFEHRNHAAHRHRYYEEEEDEFERDPWNAVCVLGLRVYSKDTDVTIEVINGDAERKNRRSHHDDDRDDASVVSSITTRKEKELDVDDSAADATSPLRTRGNLESVLANAEKVSHVGSAPAGHELDRSGTLS